MNKTIHVIGEVIRIRSWEELSQEMIPDILEPEKGYTDEQDRFFHKSMVRHCGTEATIKRVIKQYDAIVLDNGWTWHENWIEKGNTNER